MPSGDPALVVQRPLPEPSPDATLPPAHMFFLKQAAERQREQARLQAQLLQAEINRQGHSGVPAFATISAATPPQRPAAPSQFAPSAAASVKGAEALTTAAAKPPEKAQRHHQHHSRPRPDSSKRFSTTFTAQVKAEPQDVDPTPSSKPIPPTLWPSAAPAAAAANKPPMGSPTCLSSYLPKLTIAPARTGGPLAPAEKQQKRSALNFDPTGDDQLHFDFHALLGPPRQAVALGSPSSPKPTPKPTPGSTVVGSSTEATATGKSTLAAPASLKPLLVLPSSTGTAATTTTAATMVKPPPTVTETPMPMVCVRV